MNLLHRIGSDTYFLYICYVLHLAQVSIREDWDTDEVELKCFLEKTNGIRGNNFSRRCALAEIYCFMRDLQKGCWLNLQLLDRRYSALETKVANKAGGQSGGHGGCGHCGFTWHPGGRKQCPLKNMSKGEAHTKALEMFNKLLE